MDKVYYVYIHVYWSDTHIVFIELITQMGGEEMDFFICILSAIRDEIIGISPIKRIRFYDFTVFLHIIYRLYKI